MGLKWLATECDPDSEPKWDDCCVIEGPRTAEAAARRFMADKYSDHDLRQVERTEIHVMPCYATVVVFEVNLRMRVVREEKV